MASDGLRSTVRARAARPLERVREAHRPQDGRMNRKRCQALVPGTSACKAPVPGTEQGTEQTMNFRLDHVVIAVADLARAVENYRALGFTVQIGGRHPGAPPTMPRGFRGRRLPGAHRLAEPGPAERWYNVHAQFGDGLMDFALIPAIPPAPSRRRRRAGWCSKVPSKAGACGPMAGN